MTFDAARRVALFGTEEKPAAVETLRAGPLSVEIEGGNLRYLRWHGVEVIRGIAFLVRDTTWGTYRAELADVAVAAQAGRFLVTYDARCEGPEGAFGYRARIEGMEDGRLAFSASGAPENDFPASRIGFVVLHPLVGLAGNDIVVEHTDASTETIRLPEMIAPDQPAFDLRAITHRPAAGVTARVVMLGDAYEMEDHRNWTDASFKTYVRPLSKPHPFVVPRGETVSQSVTVEIDGIPPPREARPAGEIELELREAAGTMPAVALGCDPEDALAALSVAHLLGAAPGRLSVRYDAALGHDVEMLAAVERLRAALGAMLTLEAVVENAGPERGLTELAGQISASRLAVSALVPSPRRDLKTRPTNSLPDGEASLEDVVRAARAIFPGIPIGAGMLTSFAELNRNRPPASLIDFVTHATCAIVHAADDRSVMETLEALPQVFRSVRAICGESLPYRIGLAAIGARENPYGKGPAENPHNRRIPMTREDPRQRGEFAAAFALGYAALAAEHGLSELVLGHIVGPLGVIHAPGATAPGYGSKAALYPVFHAVAALAAAAGRPRMATHSSSDELAAIAYDGDGRPALLLANKTDKPIRVRLPDGAWTVRPLGSSAEESAARERALELPPYGQVLGTRRRG